MNEQDKKITIEILYKINNLIDKLNYEHNSLLKYINECLVIDKKLFNEDNFKKIRDNNKIISNEIMNYTIPLLKE